MKKYIVTAGLCLLMSSCLNDEFLEVYPQDQQTELTAFKTYDNFKTYTWGLYNVLTGYQAKTGQSDQIFRGDYEADNAIKHVAGNESQWAYQKAQAPASSDNWDYSYIRRVNLMLDNLEKSTLNEADQAHWRSVGYFFRSYKYFQMMSLFGDIPWVEHVLSDNSEELYNPRDSRDLVAANILSNLKYAEENIKVDGDGDNTINKNVVRALISRFALFEGTWRKYHGLPDAEKYLEECVRVSAELVKAYPDLCPSYEDVFNSESLSGIAGIILYKEYVTGQLGHGLTRMVRTGESQIEATKDMVDSYLCSDGKPVGSSELYDGDKDVYDQFRNRDNRLYFTVCPPYMIEPVGTAQLEWTYTDNPKEREYIDLMATLASETGHRLPSSNFKEMITRCQPHLKNYNYGQGWQTTQMGFWVWKYYNTHTPVNTAAGVCTTDAPLFRMGEILVNYAEAMFELGRFDQSIADITINKLRERAKVSPMVVGNITTSFDPARDPDVAPVLWEIRRERRVELFGEGFRLDDLRRWKKGKYVDKQPLGTYVTDANTLKVKVKNGVSDNEGYIYFFAEPKGWLDYYYLYPLPLNQLALNENLKQNDKWK